MQAIQPDFLETLLTPLFKQLAPGLTRSAQLEVLFQSYELAPDVFLTRLESLRPSKRKWVISALELARQYCIYRERAGQHDRTLEKQGFHWHLVRNLDPQIRAEAREWLGFWAQSRQGSWTELQWVERGVRTHVNFEASELFARALPLRPRALVLIHNHPSGNTEPSWVDQELTHRVGALAGHLGIELKGHWIVGPGSETWLPFQLRIQSARPAARSRISASANSSSRTL
ncbi:MAG: JAB domain-containing protein [Oligoflexia bacterium]